ncbi:ADP-ribosylation factor-like protein 15 [Musca domestica]|uniref:ADP-ribosylation factor-like protein 15 n=1 Tax=Musca domestica TaxID=7370 RepID=A0A9J7DNN5_MUSDO|nr:ADP-ribosylation factor-like protein 15 [Musca domestica]
MGVILCKFCCCRCCKCWDGNSVGVLPEKKLKFLLLGLAGSGKTEIGHYLMEKQRLDYESTNGAHNYSMKCGNAQCSITEIGGNDDIQNIWHHYYAGTMAIIYCFDLSSTWENMKKSFSLLHKTLKNPYISGKPVLLVATKADQANESIQLYDIENSFRLQRMASTCGSALRLCVYDPGTSDVPRNSNTTIKSGINWLVKYILDNYDLIQMRLSCDKNMKDWEEHRNKLVTEGKLNFRAYQRFPKASNRHKLWRLSHKRLRRSLIRPRTAPPKLSFISTSKENNLTVRNTFSSTQISLTDSSKVPNGVLPHEDNSTVI